MVAVVFFAGGDGDGEDILGWRDGAGGVVGEGAGWVIRFIEVDGGRAIGSGFVYAEETAGGVSGFTAGLVTKDDEEFIAFLKRVEGVFFRADIEDQFSGGLLLAGLAKDVPDRDPGGLGGGF